MQSSIYLNNINRDVFNPFVQNAPYSFLMFSRGWRKSALGTNGLNTSVCFQSAEKGCIGNKWIKTLSNIYAGTFTKNSYWLKAVNYFRRKFHHRCPNYTSDKNKLPDAIEIAITIPQVIYAVMFHQMILYLTNPHFCITFAMRPSHPDVFVVLSWACHPRHFLGHLCT